MASTALSAKTMLDSSDFLDASAEVGLSTGQEIVSAMTVKF